MFFLKPTVHSCNVTMFVYKKSYAKNESKSLRALGHHAYIPGKTLLPAM